MNWTGYADVLRRRWRIATLVVLLSVGVALLITQFQDKRYQSSIRLLVSGSSPGSSDDSASRDLAAERARLFAQLATTDSVVAAAEQNADTTFTGHVANTHISVSASAHGGDFLTIKVTSDDPDAAQAVAQAYPLVLPSQLAKINQLPPVGRGALLTPLSRATRPSHPSSPRPLINIAIGLGAGVLLGVVAAGLREFVGTGLKDARQIRQLARGKVLAVVPAEFDDERLAVASRPQSRRSAGYRDARDRLVAAGDPRSFVVTSPDQGEGKSTMAANLALLYGRAGRRVAVVDTDLRRPALAASFNVASETGLADVLSGTAALRDVLKPVPGEQVSVLAGGQDVADAKAVLAWPTMAELLRTLTAEFDVVVVDAPPVLAGSEALLLGALTDGVLLVARPSRTTRPGLRRALAAAQRSPAKLLGVVVNAADPTDRAVRHAEAEQPPAAAPGEPAVVETDQPALEQLLDQPPATFNKPVSKSSARQRRRR